MNNQSREQKIEILKAIQAGKVDLSDLYSAGPWILDWDMPWGDALNAGSRQVISREQFERRAIAGLIKGTTIDWGIKP